MAKNLVEGDTNATSDVFVHDLTSGTLTRVSTAFDDTEGNTHADAPSISADGRYVAFETETGFYVDGQYVRIRDVYVYDTTTGTTTRVSIATDGTQGNSGSGGWGTSAISADGRHIAFASRAWNLVPGDLDSMVDVFVHEMPPA